MLGGKKVAVQHISGHCGRALSHEAFSKRCSVCFVDLVCFSQNCNSITQVGVVVSL